MEKLEFLEEVVFLEGEIWNKVPTFPKVVVSNLGRVAMENRSGKYKTLTQREVPTSKGSYLAVRVKIPVSSEHSRISSVFVSRYVHVLIALAFHGVPEGYGNPLITVNHKDGDKHNNREDNLEWNTRSENIIHAYKNGLRSENTKVIVKDHKTGEVVEYYSINEFAREFNVSKTKAQTLLSNYSDVKYEDRYTFERDLDGRVVNRHKWVKDIMALDYSCRKLIVAKDSVMMERQTGVKRATILYNLRQGNQKLVGGFLFRYMGYVDEWPKFTQEEIERSICEFKEKPIAREKRFGVKVLDYNTSNVIEYLTFKEAEEKEGFGRGIVQYLLNQKPNSLYKGRSVKYRDDTEPFKEFSKEEIQASMYTTKTVGTVFKCTDLQTDTTKCFPTIRAFALEVNENPVSMSNGFRINPEKPFKGRYRIETVNA